jgi:hypothetical protein
MSLKIWAIKVGELKPLSRAGLLLLSARCAIRVEPWLPPNAEALFRQGLDELVAAAFEETTQAGKAAAAAAKLGRELSNRGATACNALAKTDPPLGRCMSYATSTLAAGLAASGQSALPALKKAIVDGAKLSASIPAVLAHAGRVAAPKGKDPVDVACVAVWDAIRADIATIAAAMPELAAAQAKNRVRALREHAPLWVGPTPIPFAKGPRAGQRTH